MSQNYTYTTSDNHTLNITTYGNSNLKSGNCIIFVHGFKGFKDWGFGTYLSRSLANNGNFVITFNFSHNGVGENSVDFNELEKFANNTYSREINELSELINAYKNNFFGIPNPKAKLGLLGHSRGGGVAIAVASKLADVNAIVTWSAISKFDRFTDRQKSEWIKNGYLEMLNSRTKQLMRLNKVLLDDIEKNSGTMLNIEKSLGEMDKPFLIIHGDQDLAVPIEEAEAIYSWSNKAKTELFKLSGAGHTFDIKHPFEGTSEALERVLHKTNTFFNHHFNEI